MTVLLVIILIVLILLLGNLDFTESKSREIPKQEEPDSSMIDFTYLDH
jgi:preprotein translocase subunit SecG